MSFLSQPVTLQSLFGTDRKFGSITVDVTISENTNDTLVITKQPVQTGAPISDHAYKEPTVLSMKIRFNDNLTKSLSKIYSDLLQLQFPSDNSGPVPLDVITLKRIYHNMLIATLSCTTDKYTENVLAIDITFQQVLLVTVSPTQVTPLKQQKLPKQTAATQNTGQSFLLQSSKIVTGGLPK